MSEQQNPPQLAAGRNTNTISCNNRKCYWNKGSVNGANCGAENITIGVSGHCLTLIERPAAARRLEGAAKKGCVWPTKEILRIWNW